MKNLWFKIIIIAILLTMGASVFYYFVIFLPKKTSQAAINDFALQQKCSAAADNYLHQQFSNTPLAVQNSHWSRTLNKCFVETNSIGPKIIYYELSDDKAIIVSSDGDYAGLIKFLLEKNKLAAILSPANVKKCSILLKRTGAVISYINDQRSILGLRKEKAPDKDKTL